MKTIEILRKKLSKIEHEIMNVAIEKHDKSYRRSGGYFGTTSADVTGLLIFKSYARTKHLNSYICVEPQHEALINQYNEIKSLLKKALVKEYSRESKIESIKVVERDIAHGWQLTNHGKMFIQGNKNIYYAHPFFKHSDYNKWSAMPNTPKHWKLAQELNQKLINAGLKTF